MMQSPPNPYSLPTPDLPADASLEALARRVLAASLALAALRRLGEYACVPYHEAVRGEAIDAIMRRGAAGRALILRLFEDNHAGLRPVLVHRVRRFAPEHVARYLCEQSSRPGREGELARILLAEGTAAARRSDRPVD